MQSNLARFTERCVALAKKAVVNDPDPPVKKGEGGYADWVIVTLHGLREYLNQPYRRLMDILQVMPAFVDILGLSTDELPDFTTLCQRKQELKMRVWRSFFGYQQIFMTPVKSRPSTPRFTVTVRRATIMQNGWKTPLNR